MRDSWTYLSESQRHTFRVTLAFIQGRLRERATIDWALKLSRDQTPMRLAVLEAIDRPDGLAMGEPWRSAWRLLEEYWNGQPVPDSSSGSYLAQERLRAGDRSGSLAAFIVELVAPRLKIEALPGRDPYLRQPGKNPRSIEDLFLVGLTSGMTVDPGVLDLPAIDDREFLISLAMGLDAAVSAGLTMAGRLGFDPDTHPWRLGWLYRAYWVPPPGRDESGHEPDQHHGGIAPSVKLLHEVVSRLVDVDPSSASMFTRRWQLSNSSIHTRLWAAMSWDRRVASPSEVAEFLLALDGYRFWDLHSYPEVVELRAKRFGEFDARAQKAIAARLRKAPPRSRYARKADPDQVERGRVYSVLRELRRIEVAGGTLPRNDEAWLRAKLHEFPDLNGMARIDEGFLEGAKAFWVQPSPDTRYDASEREARLQALEKALGSTDRGWDDDPVRGAVDWIREPSHCLGLLADFEAAPDAGAAYPQVWDRFGWSHSPGESAESTTERLGHLQECRRVLALLLGLPLATVAGAIEGISYWLSVWDTYVVSEPDGKAVWFRIWPIAVELTNAVEPVGETIELNAAGKVDQGEPMDLDTLNSPAGRLVGVFLRACPPVKPRERPFDADEALRKMRDAIGQATGRTRLIAQHRMAEWLNYFLRADRPWAQTYLVAALDASTPEAVALWRAISRRTQSFDVLKSIGVFMLKRTIDPALGRESRGSLVFSLVVECLHSFLKARRPAVPYPRIQQMIRSLDGEVRARAAQAVTQFVREVSALPSSGSGSESRERVFREAAIPFLRHVWPQERSLTTPEVSRAFAELPVVSGGAFVDAVNAVERFLTPFDCWSISDYGFRRGNETEDNLSSIDTEEKASALLQLLGLTIRPGSPVIPHELADALDVVRNVAPSLTTDPVFRRLATATRRG